MIGKYLIDPQPVFSVVHVAKTYLGVTMDEFLQKSSQIVSNNRKE